MKFEVCAIHPSLERSEGWDSRHFGGFSKVGHPPRGSTSQAHDYFRPSIQLDGRPDLVLRMLLPHSDHLTVLRNPPEIEITSELATTLTGSRSLRVSDE
jgi:hypothetical protein